MHVQRVELATNLAFLNEYQQTCMDTSSDTSDNCEDEDEVDNDLSEDGNYTHVWFV